MATHGSIPKFHAGKEDWSTWIAQLQYYFSANKVTDDDQKRAILLSNVAPSVFKLIRNLLGDNLDMATLNISQSREVFLPAKTLGNHTTIQV